MKAYAILKYGKDPLELIEVDKPSATSNEVLVKVCAASINPIDFKIRNGKVKILLPYELPLILGNDLSGIVCDIGSNVNKFKIGDPIYARVPKHKIGTFAEFIAVDESAVAIKPPSLTFEEAASIPLVGLTSYQAINDILRLQSGQKIFIPAGAGGVGTFAIQLAKSLGAYVATTASEAGRDLVSSLGADLIIDYKSNKFENYLKDYDAVFDTLGGESLKRSFQILKEGGKVVSITGMPNSKFGKDYGVGFFKQILFALLTTHLTILEKKYGVEYIFLFMKHNGDQLEKISDLIEQKKIKPIIDRIYSFSETQKAISYSESGRAKGKIIIKVSS
ncbi:MAG: NADP-dependent oxidoreductase [Bdellovibrionota bacterium]